MEACENDWRRLQTVEDDCWKWLKTLVKFLEVMMLKTFLRWLHNCILRRKRSHGITESDRKLSNIRLANASCFLWSMPRRRTARNSRSSRSFDMFLCEHVAK
uniref:Ovule protein n=1 Tax=Steinernema glaseri TaxID=37863 RepID=A0A1I7ZFC9_9BILA